MTLSFVPPILSILLQGRGRELVAVSMVWKVLVGASVAIKQSKAKGHIQVIQFLVVKWQDEYHQLPMVVVNK